jgi:hypothetical protein
MHPNTNFLTSTADLAGLLASQAVPTRLAPEDRTDHLPDAMSGLLASQAEIVGLLAGLAGPMRRSARNRQDAAIARSALSAILSNPADESPTPIPTSAIIVRAVGSPQRAAQPPVIDNAPVRTRKRAHCACGACQWCLDNARWDRIFNEKFADPSYYGSLKISYNSCLSGAR